MYGLSDSLTNRSAESAYLKVIWCWVLVSRAVEISLEGPTESIEGTTIVCEEHR